MRKGKKSFRHESLQDSSSIGDILLSITKAIEKGKGKPHLKPVKDTMADANKLAAAMIIAPFAGIAAATGKFYKMTKNRGM